MRRPGAGPWMAGAFGIALLLALAVLLSAGTGDGGTIAALRLTARWSYLCFWPAYAGGALAALFGPTFRSLAERGREFGLAFAAAQLVHAGLVLWLYYSSAHPPGQRTLLIFGIALFWTYLLAVFSIRRIAGTLAPRVWRAIRTLGVEYIALAFLIDFAKNPFQGSVEHALAYLPFQILAVAAPALRLAAFMHRRARSRRPVAHGDAAASTAGAELQRPSLAP